MKNHLQIIIGILLTGFMFFSCSKQTSIVKRKYNKGYYISHTAKKSSQEKQDVVVAKYEKKEYVSADAINKKGNNNHTLNQNRMVAESAIKQASDLSNKQSAKHKQTLRNKQKFGYTAFAGSSDKIKRIGSITGNKNLIRKIETKSGNDAASDVLSLFWIIILLVLILYLIGLLFGSFGLGWAIHLLGIVVLVLLILWLLRLV